MKIIYLTNICLPSEKAYSIYVLKMCEALVNVGNQVELIATKRYNPNFRKSNVFEYYNLNQNFKIKKLLSSQKNYFIINT